jgi:hypothetical protein
MTSTSYNRHPLRSLLFLPPFLWIGCAFPEAVAAAAVAQSSSSACFASRRPPARLQRSRRCWLLCAHSVVHHPHPRCLCPTPRRRCCPRARLCPVRTTTTADPPPEVGEDRPLDVPDVNARSPSRPPRVNCRCHRWRRMPHLPRMTSLTEGEDKGHDPSPSILS